MHKEVKTSAELDAATATGKVVVDFWATWCGPCQMMGQRIATELEPAFPDISVVKVNVDEEPELCERYRIASIPNLVLFQDGDVIDQSAGARPKPMLAQFIEQAL